MAPIMDPKMLSLSKVISKLNCLLKAEKTKNATIVYTRPIKSPVTRPVSLCFFKAIKTPRKILTPFII